MPPLEQVTNHLSILGEGPVWDATEGRIIWVDILKGHIHQYYPNTKQHLIFKTGQLTGAVAVRKAGGFIAAQQNGFARIYPDNGISEIITDPEAHLPGNRFNDGKCDPAGRFWAGTMALSEKANEGSLYMLETDGSVSLKLKEVTCSNGLAWNSERRLMYFIDSPTLRVMAYKFEVKNGAISDEQVAIKFPDDAGYPDGMTIDTDGMLWIAFWNGWKIERWDPHTAQMLYRIELPVSLVTSCTFGGENMDDLYITSARTGLSTDELSRQPLAGALFVIKKCGHQGIPAYEFLG